MKNTHLPSLVLVANHVLFSSAIPNRHDKRQVELLDAYSKGNMSAFMKSRASTVELEKFAQALGASHSEAGDLYDFIRNIANGDYGITQRKPDHVPEREEVPPRTKIPNSKTIKQRIGPFKVPNKNIKNIVGESGMLYNYPIKDIKKPCQGKCTILSMTAGVEYPDGENASFDTGLWLHHTILLNIGEGRSDASRRNHEISIPHVLVGSTSRKSERIFASGNERTPVFFPNETHSKIGYKLKDDDKFAMVINLMNITPKDKIAYVTVTFDIVDGHPQDWRNITPVWLELDECDEKDIVRKRLASEKISIACDWTSDLDGDIFGAAGHLHDGGNNLVLDVNGKQVCDSFSTYATFPTPAELSANDQQLPIGGHGSRNKHIRNMSICRANTLGISRMAKGQKWTLRAVYDIDPTTLESNKVEEGDYPAVSMIYMTQQELNIGA